jgi:hypothetical protein
VIGRGSDIAIKLSKSYEYSVTLRGFTALIEPSEFLMSPPTNMLEVHYGSTVHRYPVQRASFLAVRYSGGFGIVILVTCDETETDTEAPAVGPDFSMILPIEKLTLEVGTQWPFRLESLANKGIGMTPIFTDWDFHLVQKMVVSIVRQNDRRYHWHMSGTMVGGREGSPPTINIDAMFEYRGITNHDESGTHSVGSPFSSHVKSKGHWQKYIIDEYALRSANGPVTEYEWQHTDRFRRLIGKLYETHSAPVPPASGVFDRIRRFFRRTPASAPSVVPAREVPTPTLRQSKLLLAASLEHLLPDEVCWVWGISTIEMARMLERYADKVPSEVDLKRVHNYNETCLIPGSAIRLDPSEVMGENTECVFQVSSMFSQHLRGMASDLFIWRLIPERSREGCDLLRCLLGNHFRSVQWHSEWRTESVIGLAQAAYELRDFSRLPILADALQEAGCEEVAILSHCRDAKIHTRGCWVLDAILQRY